MAKLELIEEPALRWPDGCDRTRIKIIAALDKANLINRSGGKISLKEL